MSVTVTAREAAIHGLPKGAMTTTPYRRLRGQRVWVRVIDARRVGCHVELQRDDGAWFLVNLMHHIFEMRD